MNVSRRATLRCHSISNPCHSNPHGNSPQEPQIVGQHAKKIRVSNAVQPSKKLWKNSADHSRADLNAAWKKVQAKTGLPIEECKDEFKKTKKCLKRWINNAVAKSQATSWNQVDAYVRENPTRSNQTDVWIELNWLAEELTKQVITKSDTLSINDTFPPEGYQGSINCEQGDLESVTRKTKARKASTRPAAKRIRISPPAEDTSNQPSEFHVRFPAVSLSVNNQKGQHSLLDIKEDFQDDDNELVESYVNAGPPVGDENNGRPILEGPQYFDGQPSAENSKLTESSNVLNFFYQAAEGAFLDNSGTVPSQIGQMAREKIFRFFGDFS